MQYSQEHLKTMVYAEFGGQTECIMGNWKIENGLTLKLDHFTKDETRLTKKFTSCLIWCLISDHV